MKLCNRNEYIGKKMKNFNVIAIMINHELSSNLAVYRFFCLTMFILFLCSMKQSDTLINKKILHNFKPLTLSSFTDGKLFHPIPP